MNGSLPQLLLVSKCDWWSIATIWLRECSSYLPCLSLLFLFLRPLLPYSSTSTGICTETDACVSVWHSLPIIPCSLLTVLLFSFKVWHTWWWATKVWALFLFHSCLHFSSSLSPCAQNRRLLLTHSLLGYSGLVHSAALHSEWAVWFFILAVAFFLCWFYYFSTLFVFFHQKSAYHFLYFCFVLKKKYFDMFFIWEKHAKGNAWRCYLGNWTGTLDMPTYPCCWNACQRHHNELIDSKGSLCLISMSVQLMLILQHAAEQEMKYC